MHLVRATPLLRRAFNEIRVSRRQAIAGQNEHQRLPCLFAELRCALASERACTKRYYRRGRHHSAAAADGSSGSAARAIGAHGAWRHVSSSAKMAAAAAAAMAVALGAIGNSFYDFKLQRHADAPHAKVLADGRQFTVGNSAQQAIVLGYPAIPRRGRSYWEVKLVHASGNYVAIGIAEGDADRSGEVGDLLSWGLRGCGSVSYIQDNGGPTRDVNMYPKLRSQETIGIDVDMDLGSLSFWVQGKLVGTPITGLRGKTLFPALSVCSTDILEIRTQLPPPESLT